MGRRQKKHAWESLDLRKEYRTVNRDCELWPLAGRALELPTMPTWPEPQVHHIWHRSYRVDEWPNLITLGGLIHEMAHHKWEREIRVACMVAKLHKQELSWDVWDRAAGQCVVAWLERLPELGEPWDGMRSELLQGAN